MPVSWRRRHWSRNLEDARVSDWQKWAHVRGRGWRSKCAEAEEMGEGGGRAIVWVPGTHVLRGPASERGRDRAAVGTSLPVR